MQLRACRHCVHQQIQFYKQRKYLLHLQAQPAVPGAQRSSKVIHPLRLVVGSRLVDEKGGESAGYRFQHHSSNGLHGGVEKKGDCLKYHGTHTHPVTVQLHAHTQQLPSQCSSTTSCPKGRLLIRVQTRACFCWPVRPARLES